MDEQQNNWCRRKRAGQGGAPRLLAAVAVMVWTVAVQAGPEKTPLPPAADATRPLVSPGKAPWQRGPARQPGPLRQPPASPRELLINVTDSELQALQQAKQLAPEDPTLLKILYRLPRMGAESVARFVQATADVDWANLVTAPETLHTQMFHLAGRVRRVDRQPLSDRAAELFEMDHYWRVQMQPDQAAAPCTVLALQVPAAWAEAKPIDERASCDALLLRATPAAKGQGQLVFAAARMAWHPDREDPARGIGASQVWLGRLGMDVGLLADLRGRDARDINSLADSQCFYQLLAAVGRADPDELWQRCRTPLPLASVLREPEKQHGKLFLVEGSARRITRIDIQRPYYRQLVGQHHYYEIDLLMPLKKNQRVRISRSKEDATGPVFANNYPVIVCALDLPSDLAPADAMNEPVRIPCFHFKLWSYKSELMRRYGEDQQQISPMLVGLRPRRVVYQHQATRLMNVVVFSVILVALAAIWAGLWWFGRSDRRFQRRALHKRFEPDAPGSLDDLAAEPDTPDEPDQS